MKAISLLAAALTAFVPHSFAANVTVDGSGDRQILGAVTGIPVPAGSDILVGYFAGLTDPQIIANQYNWSYLESTFVSFGLGGAVGLGVGGLAGAFTFDTDATVEAPGATFAKPTAPNGSQIYIWIYDSALSPAAATGQAIFTSTAANWSWPTSDDFSTDRVISPDDNLTMLVGSVDSGAVRLQTVPEPGSCALLVVSLVGLLGLRPFRRFA